MMGNDGMVGLTVFLGTETTPTQALSHIAGDALRMPADRFRAEAQQHSPLQDVLRCYTQSFVTQIAQWRPATGSTRSRRIMPAACS
ncbi:MAG TPA: hypothetical protein VLK82_17795 [Candidatus Tectomicrobia bacterium]|nr:hypothetical protein [Candidatus Tectomicrobia bacterium]